MATLQEHYNLLIEGKATDKDVFLKNAKALFPQYIPNHFGFDLTTQILKQKSVLTEGYVDLGPSSDIMATPKESYELAFDKFLNEAKKEKVANEEKIKAELKKTDKSVDDKNDNDYDQKNMKTVDNVIFDQLQRGVYTEMSKDPDQDLKKVKDKVLKNLSKDPIYYTKNSAFGLEIPGYTDKLPGANPPKSDKMEVIKGEKVKSNVKDGLTKTESAKKGSKPKEIKSEMTQTSKTSKGVKKMDMPGKEKIIKLKEGMSLADLLNEGDDLDSKLARYDNMSDEEIISWANDEGWDQNVELDGEGKLINRKDLLIQILDLEDYNTDGEYKEAEHDFGPDDLDPAGGYGPQSHLEEGPLEDADAQLAKQSAAKEAEAAAIEKQRADNKLKIANANKSV